MSYIRLRVREMRETLGWSQRELARRSGVRHATISEAERGRSINLTTLEKLADALDKDAAILIVHHRGLVGTSCGLHAESCRLRSGTMFYIVQPRQPMPTAHDPDGMTEIAPPRATSPATSDSAWRQAGAYAMLVVLPLVGMLAVLRRGTIIYGNLPSRIAENAAPLVPAAMAVLRPSLLLAQLVAILTVSRLTGRLFARFGQPRVIGEMFAGVLLGPSALGLLAPHLYELLFPRGSVRFLNALSQVGLMLFMFLVGLELDVSAMRRHGRAVILAAHAGIAIPFFLATATAFILYQRLAPAGVPFLAFALFVGVAMSVTAFPVLARIIAEQKWRSSALASLALSTAAVSDVTAWCILAVVIAVARDAATPIPLWITVGGLMGLVILMATAGKRGVAYLAQRLTRETQRDHVNDDALAAVIIVVLACALATELLGVHALFGAFLAGVIMPKDQITIRAIEVRLREVLSIILLPIFFTFAGLRLKVGLIADGWTWGICALVVGVAVVGKVGGSALAGRASGFSWRNAVSLGVLMNTRGLMELVVLNIGLDAGIISPPLYAVLVLMALLTTVMTAPLLRFIGPQAPHLEAQPAIIPSTVSTRWSARSG